jgi:hypothetical protein
MVHVLPLALFRWRTLLKRWAPLALELRAGV